MQKKERKESIYFILFISPDRPNTQRYKQKKEFQKLLYINIVGDGPRKA